MNQGACSLLLSVATRIAILDTKKIALSSIFAARFICWCMASGLEIAPLHQKFIWMYLYSGIR